MIMNIVSKTLNNPITFSSFILLDLRSLYLLFCAEVYS